MKFIVRSAGGTFLLQLFYLASGFATTLLLTKWLGIGGLGAYNFVISWMILITIFVRFGFEEYLVRETAAAQALATPKFLTGLWNFSRCFVLASSGLACGLVLAIVYSIDFENTALTYSFTLGVCMIPILAMTALYRGRFRAHKAVFHSQMPDSLIRPLLLMLIVIWLMSAGPGDPWTAILVNVVATGIALGYCLLAMPFVTQKTSALDVSKNLQLPKAIPNEENSIESGDHWPALNWLMGALPFVLIAGIAIVNQRLDRLMLGALQDMQSVGLYSVAVQMAMVVSFTLIGLNQAVAPLVAERCDSNRSQELQYSLLRATNFATAGSLLIVMALVLFGPIVLAAFGPEFSDSYLPMIILAVGQLLNVASGPVGTLLSMSRHERLVGFGMAVSVVCNIVLNYLLIPLYGVNGAAIATAVSVGVWNVLLVIFAKRILGINTNACAFLIPNRPKLQ